MKKTGVGFRNMTLSSVRQAEIEDLALRFRDEMKAEILKHCSSKAVGVVGSFVVNIETHRALYAKKLDAIRAGADATTVFLADEVGREIDALATSVEFGPGAADHQIPLEIHKIGLSDNQLEVIMRTAEPMAKEKCKSFCRGWLRFCRCAAKLTTMRFPSPCTGPCAI